MTTTPTPTRCKKHYSDVSSMVGVCASCLRECLSSIIASEAHALARSRDQDPGCIDNPAAARPSDPPPPLVFPRSVSPYVARRHGNYDSFFHTPQAGPMTRDTFSVGDSCRGSGRNGRWSRKLSFLQHLLVFRSRSDRVDLETDHNQYDSPESSPSLLSHLKGRWKNRPPLRGKNTSYADGESSSHRQNGWTIRPMPDRGLPRDSDVECCRGYSLEWATPASVAGRRNGRGYPTEVERMRYFLSPKVRASPARRRRPTSEAGCSIDVRVPAELKPGRRGGRKNNRDR